MSHGDFGQVGRCVDIDPAWEPVRAAAVDYSAGPIPPGRGYVVRIPLKRVAAGEPAGIHRSATPAERGILAALLIAAALLLPWSFYRREKGLGRFEPLIPVSKIDQAWLEENVFSFLPEVVGAALDERTSAPEVAAVLARLVGVGKLESRVEKKGWGSVYPKHPLPQTPQEQGQFRRLREGADRCLLHLRRGNKFGDRQGALQEDWFRPCIEDPEGAG